MASIIRIAWPAPVSMFYIHSAESTADLREESNADLRGLKNGVLSLKFTCKFNFVVHLYTAVH